MSKRMTYDDICEYVKNNSECEIIGDTYRSGRKIYIFKCGCGKEFKRSFTDFKKGSMKCKECNDLALRKERSFGYDYVKHYIESKGCRLVDKEYINCDTKITVICGECGEEFNTTFYNFKNKKMTRCKKCSFKIVAEKQSLNYEYVVNVVEKDGCTLLSKTYKNNTQKLKIKCHCGETFYNNYAELRVKNVIQCPNCGRKLCNKDRKTKPDDMYKYAKNVGINIETVLNDNTTIHDSIIVKCKCGERYTTTFFRIKYNNQIQCGKCSKSYSWDYKEVKAYIEENSKCKLISKTFKTVDSKLTLECECGNRFKTTFDKFKGKRMKRQCNDCSTRSNMERLVKDILYRNNIEYIPEKIFDDCINPKTNCKLRYDFWIESYNTLIECDGIQHFKVTKFHKESDEAAIDRFNQQTYRDNIKTDYANKNGYTLIRIPYYNVDNIEEILNKELNLNINKTN